MKMKNKNKQQKPLGDLEFTNSVWPVGPDWRSLLEETRTFVITKQPGTMMMRIAGCNPALPLLSGPLASDLMCVSQFPHLKM